MLERLEQSGALRVLELLTEVGAKPYVCAGAVRDVFFCLEGGEQTRPRDIDIAILNIDGERLNHFAVSLGATMNRYGGYSYKSDDQPSIDFWAAKDTCGVKAWGTAPTIENVLRSFVLNLNAIAFDFTTVRFFDLGCTDALRTKSLGLVDRVLIHDQDIFAAKALAITTRFSVTPTKDIVNLFASHAVQSAINHEFSKLTSFFGPSIRMGTLVKEFLSRGGNATKACELKKLT
jgi:hypothetical protein